MQPSTDQIACPYAWSSSTQRRGSRAACVHIVTAGNGDFVVCVYGFGRVRSNLKPKACHTFPVLPDELLALARRFTVLLYTVAELQEAVVARSLGFGASAAAKKLDSVEYVRPDPLRIEFRHEMWRRLHLLSFTHGQLGRMERGSCASSQVASPHLHMWSERTRRRAQLARESVYTCHVHVWLAQVLAARCFFLAHLARPIHNGFYVCVGCARMCTDTATATLPPLTLL